ncbi:MAG: aminotransferase class III-fold pyridoxal phosphate-dependent enzyme [Rhodobacteraceae bacterium]|nr:MAG: aminotransferase class III-fold pyridoxal phosphate-dependent enzyme [Paracoccaceae bacterium]
MTARTRPILDMNAFEGDAGDDALLARRLANFGAASVLFYDQPIEMVRGRGAWMEAADGTSYLDFYNNVMSVGHCHPQVVAAIAAQAAELAINSRYLHPKVETYLERLKATLPDGLANAVLCCSGSEANDLAMRIAMKATGARGFIVTEAAYHGNTLAVTEISPASWKRGGRPDHVRLVAAPTVAAYGPDPAAGFAAAVAAAAADLEASGFGLAAFICDSILSSDGVYADPAGFLASAADAARAAGGLYIADEVQPGFGRTGAGMWGFARHGVVPDIVTMGKPMGDGYPMAGMVTRPDLLARFCDDTGYFNTFGANPVAAAAGLAVLDAIREEGMIANAATSGEGLLAALREIAAKDERIAEVRGAGLFIGIEMNGPDAGMTVRRMTEALRARRVLIGAAGRFGETLKIRPPLSLAADEADFFLDGFRAALDTLPVSLPPRAQKRLPARARAAPKVPGR